METRTRFPGSVTRYNIIKFEDPFGNRPEGWCRVLDIFENGKNLHMLVQTDDQGTLEKISSDRGEVVQILVTYSGVKYSLDDLNSPDSSRSELRSIKHRERILFQNLVESPDARHARLLIEELIELHNRRNEILAL